MHCPFSYSYINRKFSQGVQNTLAILVCTLLIRAAIKRIPGPVWVSSNCVALSLDHILIMVSIEKNSDFVVSE